MLILNEVHNYLYEQAIEKYQSSQNERLYNITHQIFYNYYINKGLDHLESHWMGICHANHLEYNKIEDNPELIEQLHLQLCIFNTFDNTNNFQNASHEEIHFENNSSLHHQSL